MELSHQPPDLYLAGTIVNIEAKPANGWQFKDWSGDLSSTTNKTTITMNSNKTITATFIVQTPSTGWTAYNDLAGRFIAADISKCH